ncbi:tripartite tricarboxylate transporter substrate binding protein [Microvirga sp. GCM10011540]|uniref:tripartite tricarboxylate transporter substrate binding protein n=1 Tax=Microvirga sp. GCM10011540 TaxID=3317338 RepID=UPI003613299D
MITRRLLGAFFAAAIASGPALAQNYPDRELTGIIMWGAGGATDVVARAITPSAEKALGQAIVLQNRPGGVGAISTAYVNSQPADGYTLLYGAENPQIHKVMGLSQIDYKDFFPVNVIARGIAVVVANNNTPWSSLKELVEDAQKRPGAIKMGSTGPGGVAHVVNTMLSNVTPFRVASIPFDGEGPGITALQGGHVDYMPVGLSAAAEHIKAGRVKVLAVVNADSLETLPNVPPITRDFPQFAKFLPWGPFYGVFVKKGAPEAAKAKLVEAFKQAAGNEQFTKMMVDRGNVMMNISGEEADDFLAKYQAVTSWTLHEAGAAKKSPEEFQIPRP